MNDDDARRAVSDYLSAQDSVRGPEQAKRAALSTLRAWMTGRESGKAEIDGHTVGLVQSRRYAVDHRRLNALLDPETPRGDRHGEPLRVRPRQLAALPGGRTTGLLP